MVQTGANSTLGITFNDATTFNLKANAQITIDNYVYEDGGKQNAGVFDVAKGTVAFVAAAVAKTGDMKITTPTATLGIRGTTGLVEVPEGAAANNPNNVAIKLYPDADGRVGRIEVNDRTGARLGFLTQGASGFTIRPGAGGARFAAVPLTISPQQMQRDQGFVRQVHATQTVGRRIVDEQRAFRRANPRHQSRQRAAPLGTKRIAGTQRTATTRSQGRNAAEKSDSNCRTGGKASASTGFAARRVSEWRRCTPGSAAATGPATRCCPDAARPALRLPPKGGKTAGTLSVRSTESPSYWETDRSIVRQVRSQHRDQASRLSQQRLARHGCAPLPQRYQRIRNDPASAR